MGVRFDGKKVREIRKKLFTPAEFAVKIGKGERTVARIESGEQVLLGTAKKVASVLRIPLDSITIEPVEGE